MKLEEFKEAIDKLETSHNAFKGIEKKGKETRLDFSRFDFSFLEKYVFETLESLCLRTSDENLSRRTVYRVFNMGIYSNIDTLRKSDKEAAIKEAIDTLNESSFSDNLYYKIFLKTYKKPSERLKSVTSGKTGLFLSNETEKKVLSAVIDIFKLNLMHGFLLIDYEEFLEKTLPSLLVILSTKETYLGCGLEVYGIFKKIEELPPSTKKDTMTNLLYAWYQENGYDFVLKKAQSIVQHDSDIDKFSFFLNFEQKKEIFYLYKKRLETNIGFYSKNISEKEIYCNYYLQGIESLKNEYARLISFKEKHHITDDDEEIEKEAEVLATPSLKVGNKIKLGEFKSESNKAYSHKVATILKKDGRFYLTNLSDTLFMDDMFSGGQLIK